MNQPNYPNQIAAARTHAGMRQLDLARKVGLHQSEVSAIERGERQPGVFLAKRIARALRTRIDDLY